MKPVYYSLAFLFPAHLNLVRLSAFLDCHSAPDAESITPTNLASRFRGDKSTHAKSSAGMTSYKINHDTDAQHLSFTLSLSHHV